MGLFSAIFGGSKTEVVTQQTAQNTTNVDVASNITNVISLDALAEALDRFLGVFNTTNAANSAAQADANILAAQATLGAALVNAKVQQANSQTVAESLQRGFWVLGILVAGALFLFTKRKRA